jgi:hypothetical protein
MPFMTDFVLEHLDKENWKELLAAEINKNVDIPMIGEATEQRVYEALLSAVETSIRAAAAAGDDDDELEGVVATTQQPQRHEFQRNVAKKP